MPTHQKDKRTKEQLLQILSNALTQEEQLGERIKILENQLAALQKQQADASAEINQHGRSASKESFRIDYYKATEKGQLKGIIEHLPSRQKKSLHGLGIKHIAHFVERFLPEEAKRQKITVAPPEPITTKAPVLVALPQPEQVESTLADRKELWAEKPVVAATMVEQPRGEAAEGTSSKLAQRLRAQLQQDLLKAPQAAVATAPAAITSPPSLHLERVRSKMAAWPAEKKMPAAPPPPPIALPTGSSLRERLRAEFRAGQPKQ